MFQLRERRQTTGVGGEKMSVCVWEMERGDCNGVMKKRQSKKKMEKDKSLIFQGT